jgi:hypothetical protein
MGSGLDARSDYLFKRLVGSEENALLLVDLLNSVVLMLNPFTA